MNIKLLLIKHRNQVLSRDQILDLLNDGCDDVYDRAIDIHISRIRSKLGDDPQNPNYIRTIRDVGYTFIANIR